MQEPQDERRREDQAPEARVGPDRRRIARIVVGLAIVVLLLLFIAGNSDEVDISFVFAELHDVPLIIVAAVSIVIGMVGGWLLGRDRRRATKRYIRELERRLEERT